MSHSFDRRDFLKLVGLGTVAGTVGCNRQHAGELVSQVFASEQNLPGATTWYATTCRECPAGCGVQAKTREGRAIKLEGNREHPTNQGGLCVRGQSALQGLYNPDRIQRPFRRSGADLQAVTWEEAENAIAERLRNLISLNQGNKVAFLSGENGESLDQLISNWMGALNSENYRVCEPFSYASIERANGITFGSAVIPKYDIAGADYLLSFGADFLETWISPVGFSRGYAAMRANHGKFVQVEPRLSLTGANADEWLSIQPGHELWIALAMSHYILSEKLGDALPAFEVSLLTKVLEPYSPAAADSLTRVPKETTERLAREFTTAKASLAIGGGVAVSGENATATQAAINLLNHVAGRVGHTVRFDEPLQPSALANLGTIRKLIDAMNQSEVEVLFLHHTNPVFNLPPRLGFAEALRKVPLVVSFSSFPDETTEFAHWLLPDHTPLEQWGDLRTTSGVHSLLQPAMNPVFDSRAAGTVLLELAGAVGDDFAKALPAKTFQDYLKANWQRMYGRSNDEEFEVFWLESLQRGGVWNEASISTDRPAKPRISARLAEFQFPSIAPAASSSTSTGDYGFFVHIYPSSRYYDGRGANKPWLQEIPDPITNVVWDSWVEIHPEAAARLGIAEGDVLRLESEAGSVEAPAYLYAGLQPNVVGVPLGQGHERYGRYAEARGANPTILLPAREDAISGALAWSGVKVKVTPTGRKVPLVRTDGSLTDHGRGFSQVISLSALTNPPQQEKPAAAAAQPGEHSESVSMYPTHEHKDYRWGMAINLSSCTGCSACVAACYAENNVPIVGKERVAQGRHMAWIRIERYLESVSDKPDVRFTPMLCQQCDNAPCEPVCPVNATMHSSDGLNVQVYNRCVGTRYCSNNCPYKVRTFNWFDYKFPEPLNLQLNPDVSQRSKGIMEKCTFCIQRIRVGKDHAKDESRKVHDGEVMPACAQSCPTQAISFGNLLDPESAVSKLSRGQHGYKILEELNTKPAITYLPRVRQA